MFIAYSKITEQWYWLQPGGIMEKIAEPQEIFLDSDWINSHRNPNGKPRESPYKIHRQRAEQLILI